MLLFVSEGSASPSQKRLVGFSWLPPWHSPCVAVDCYLPGDESISSPLLLFAQCPKVSRADTGGGPDADTQYAPLLSAIDSLSREIGELVWPWSWCNAKGKIRVKCQHDDAICGHSNLGKKPTQNMAKKSKNSSSEKKKKQQIAVDSWCLWGNAEERSMFLDHNMRGKYFDISTNQHLMTFTPSRGHCRQPPPTHTPSQHIAPIQLLSCYSCWVLSHGESCTCR